MNALARLLAVCVVTILVSTVETSTMADVPSDSQSYAARADQRAAIEAWADAAFGSNGSPRTRPRVQIELRRQDHVTLGWGVSCIGTPLRLGDRAFEHGLGTHANSEIVVQPPQEATEFRAVVGIDNNYDTQAARGSAVFSVALDEQVAFESPVLRGDSAPLAVRLAVPRGTGQILLRVTTAGDGAGWDHADWADAHFVLGDGTRLYLDENQVSAMPPPTAPPFSFRFGDSSSEDCLRQWPRSIAKQDGETATIRECTWTDPETGLRLTARVTSFKRFPAVDWVLSFENTGTTDTSIIADVRALDMILHCPLAQGGPYRLHRTLGAPSNPRDFEPREVAVTRDDPQRLSAGGGLSSNADFPFFTIETGGGVWIVAVGWSGQWEATVECPGELSLHVDAGQQATHFRLRPGERIRSPRILLFHSPGDVAEAHAQFRQLIHAEYAARRGEHAPEPVLFCNTCFTRGGGWLNECNAENQISLIRAYAPFGLEALITDAGWFEGGWPHGAGNWTPRKDAYPQGMGPLAAAARAHGVVYGLWFEPERVVAGSALQRAHPEWLLRAADGDQQTYLANFALPEVQEYFFQIVKGYMDLPGFRFYRQDFTVDPLPYWRYSDPPDRQGISEAKYLEGLYAFWDRIARTWPDSLREECAGGGRRIDLETIMRMHVHQRSDYWFDNEVEQASLWSLSRYLPNNVITTALNRLDDYSFHSALPSSLCLGWIADAPDFDAETARRLTETYRRVRHLLVGAWYPLLPYSRDTTLWLASQYHRPDLGEGMIVAFRRPESPYSAVVLKCRGLDADADYELRSSRQDEVRVARGRELLEGLEITIPDSPGSELITYRRVR